MCWTPVSFMHHMPLSHLGPPAMLRIPPSTAKLDSAQSPIGAGCCVLGSCMLTCPSSSFTCILLHAGLTKVPIDGQPKSIVKDLEDMARTYIKVI